MKLETKKEMKDYKEALELTIDLWEWLKNNPNKIEFNWPRFEEIKDMKEHCPLCNLYLKYIYDYTEGIILERQTHGKCPLSGHIAKNQYSKKYIICCIEFYNWNNSNNEEDRKKYATTLYNKLLKIKKEHKKYKEMGKNSR